MQGKLKQEVFFEVKEMLARLNIEVSFVDDERPWGGFFVIEPDSSILFTQYFFPNLEINHEHEELAKSAKILVVAPNKRLSWQFHERRNEIWKVVNGQAGVVTSENDEENELTLMEEGDIIRLNKGIRHRLVGLTDWSFIAEIWEHTDVMNPSNEEDIIRVQDDFGR